MAVDSPLIHDGSLCTAFANYYNGAAFLGVGGTAQFLAVSLQAAKVVQVATGPTAGPVYGVLQNTPMAGEAADVGIIGVTKAVAGAAITFGAELMVGTGGTLGQFVTWVNGAGNYKVGLALEGASAQGVVFSMLIYNPNVRFATL